MSNSDHYSRPPPILSQGSSNTKQSNMREVRSTTSSYAHILTLGKNFKRYNSNSITKAFSASERFVWVPSSLDCVMWAKAKNDSKFAKVPAKDIITVGPIKQDYADPENNNLQNEYAFSIQFTQGSLELACNSEDERDHWVKMFTWLKENNSPVSRPFNFQHTVSVNSDFTWELSPGQTLDSIFELGALLGQGTFGRVHKAVHKPSGFTLAVKLVNCQSVQDIDDVQREVDVLKLCRFKNIVDYFGCCGPDKDNNLWMFMNYCQFGSIIDLLVHSNAYLQEIQISYIIASTLMGLHYLHTVKNVIHRDIKGRNILVSNNGCIKLTDFGISKKLTSSEFNNGQGNSYPGATTGTGSPHWMACEVVQDMPATSKSDIWSLGITAIELTTGLPPRANESIYQVMNSIVTLPPPTLPPPNNGGGWSYEFHDFVAQCLRKNPNERPTAADLLKHPFIKKGIAEIRCLDEILNQLEVPRHPETDINSNATNNNVSSNASKSTKTKEDTNAIKIDKDDFDEAQNCTAFSSNFSFTIPPALTRTLAHDRLTVVQEFALPPFFEVIVGIPHTKSTSVSTYSTYPIQIQYNLVANPRQCPIANDTVDKGSVKLYKILSSNEPLIVWRRYSDVAWLHETLQTIYPDVMLPPLPEKTISNRFDDDVLRERRQGLQWCLEFIARHPVLSKSFVVHNFLVYEDAKISELKKYIKNRIQDVKKIYKQYNGVLPEGMVLKYDDEVLWRICIPLPSLPIFSRVKRTLPETEALLAIYDQYYIDVMDAYSKDVISYLSNIESCLLKFQHTIHENLKNLQKVGIFAQKSLDSYQQGRKMLAVQSKSVMTEKLKSCGYDVNLGQFDLKAYLLQKIDLYARQYGAYFAPLFSPNCSADVATTKLKAILETFIDMDTNLTPCVTLMYQKFSRILAPALTSLSSSVFFNGVYPMVFYNKIYTGLRHLISTRDTYLLHCQQELRNGTQNHNGNLSIQNTTYPNYVGYGSEIHDPDAHIDKALLNIKCNLVRNRINSMAVSNFRIPEPSEIEGKSIEVITDDTPPSPSPLLHSSPIVENPILTVVPRPSPSAMTNAMILPQTASRPRFDAFADSVINEFTMIQRQKEAHFVHLARNIAKSMAAAAATEEMIWSDLIREIDVFPQNADFFDLPL